MNRIVKFSILAIIILITISVYLISQTEIEPPPAILKIDGKEQISGIGSYCWKETWKALCADMIGIPTAQEPLVAGSPFTAHLRLPVQESPYNLYDMRLNIAQVKNEDELNFSGRGWRWWNQRGEKNFTLPLEHEQDIELSLEPGLYILNIEAWWKDIGSASYGFLVEVQANGKPEVLKINPVIDYNPLEGFYNISEGMFTVMKGSIQEVKESLKDVVIKKAVQQSTFSVDDELNFIVFRGVFSTGGYAIIIDRVEKQGNTFTVYATYSEPGKGVGVTEAVTQPVAIIPIGKLAAGDYKARLKMTRVIVEDVGIKVIETEKELSVFNFKVQSIATTPITPISPPVDQTPSIKMIQPNSGIIGTKVVITGAGFTARDNNVAFRLESEDSNNSFKIGYINNLVSRDGRTIEFVIPELLGACAFPLPETTPVTGCPDIGLNFKSGTQTYPIFVVNQNGTSNSVNFTVSR